MSPSSASTSAASLRRSTFRPEKAASTWRMTRQSPLQRVLTSLNIQPPSTFRSEQQPALGSTFPTWLKLGSSSTRKLVVDCDSVASSLSSTRKVVADHETVVSVEESVSRGKRDRDLNVVQTLKDRHSVHKFLERKAELAVQETSHLRKDYLKLKQKWSEIGKRENLILLFMRLIKNWSLNDWSYNRRTNGLTRLKEWRIHCGELEMRNRFFRENRAKAVGELRRMCCEETDRAGQARIDDLVYASKEGSCCYESTLDSNSAITNRVNSLSDARELLRSWSSEQLWSVPRSFVNSCLFRVPEQCLAAILTFLNDCLLEKDHPQLSSKIRRIWHHLLADLDLTLQEIRWYRKVKLDGNRRIRQCLYHAFKEEVESLIILVELILTVGRWVTRDFQSRKCIWENSQTLEFQSWKVNFKTEVCSKKADPNLTMHWIKEVEIAKSFDEPVTSRSIMERTDFPHYDMLDATIASALKKLLNTHVHFRKRASVEGQLDQKYDRFLRVRQIAYMIYEHFRATGVYEAVQGLSDLFNIHMQNDDVQDFDVRWDQALLSASEILTEMILERL